MNIKKQKKVAIEPYALFLFCVVVPLFTLVIGYGIGQHQKPVEPKEIEIEYRIGYQNGLQFCQAYLINGEDIKIAEQKFFRYSKKDAIDEIRRKHKSIGGKIKG